MILRDEMHSSGLYRISLALQSKEIIAALHYEFY
jgi:hypothetical protein